MAVQMDDGAPLVTQKYETVCLEAILVFAAVVSWVVLPYSALCSGNKNVVRAFVSE